MTDQAVVDAAAAVVLVLEVDAVGRAAAQGEPLEGAFGRGPAQTVAAVVGARGIRVEGAGRSG